MDNNKDNITLGLPKPGGAVYWAPLGTTLPTDATTALSTVSDAYTNLGYITEDGATDTVSESSDKIREWGGEPVMISQTEFSQTFSVAFLESIRPAVLKLLKGDANVKENADGSIAATTTGEALPRGVLVVETLQNNGGTSPRYHRIVFGDCQISDRSGDVAYNRNDPVSYPTVFEAFKFESQVNGEQTYKDEFWSPVTGVSA